MRPLLIWGICLTAAGVTAYDWSFRIDDSMRQERLDHHAGIVQRTEPDSTRYRILVPYALNLPIRALTPTMGYEKAFGRVYALYYWLAFAGVLFTLHRYLTAYFTTEQALVGVLAVATTMPMALRFYAFAPYSFVEPIFFTLALMWIRQHRHVALAALVLIASLTRETSIFIVFFYVATMPLDRRHVQIAAGYLAIWAAVFLSVRWYAGQTGTYWDLATIWLANTHTVEQILIAATSWALFLGVFWLFAALGISRAPAFVRRTALVVPVYLVTILIWGIWIEAGRLWMSMYPVLVPLALSYLFTARDPELGRGLATDHPIRSWA
jgi:hypothetical protein